MTDHAHSLSLIAITKVDGEPTNGSNVSLKIDGQEFVASGVMLALAGGGSNIVEATVTFALKQLEVDIKASVITTDLESTEPELQDIKLTSLEAPDLLQWQDVTGATGVDFILVAEPNLPIMMQVFENE